jgi:hypothetical protein
MRTSQKMPEIISTIAALPDRDGSLFRHVYDG